MTWLEQRGAARVFFIAFLSIAGSCSQLAQKDDDRKEMGRQLTEAYYSCVRTSFASQRPTMVDRNMALEQSFAVCQTEELKLGSIRKSSEPERQRGDVASPQHAERRALAAITSGRWSDALCEIASMNNIFLYLLGFAGTGKLTIARAFARAVGAKVVDNHWINKPDFRPHRSGRCVAFAGCGYRSQTAKVREAVLETIATLAKPGTNFVFTHDGIEGERYDQDVSRGIQSTAARRDARLIPVRLVCNEDELVRRIQSADRAPMLKCTDPADAIHKVATTPCSIQACLGL